MVPIFVLFCNIKYATPKIFCKVSIGIKNVDFLICLLKMNFIGYLACWTQIKLENKNHFLE